MPEDAMAAFYQYLSMTLEETARPKIVILQLFFYHTPTTTTSLVFLSHVYL